MANNSSFHSYGHGLSELANELHGNYYEALSAINNNIYERCESLKIKRLSQDSMLFVSLCYHLADDVQDYLTYRQNTLYSYLLELANKERTEHNCHNCSGRCDIEHTAQLLHFTASLEEIKKTLYVIKTTILKEDRSTDVELKTLHNLVAKLEDNLNELLQIEEQYLLPEIRRAQNKIHATN